jgi:hypothetical protein
MMNTAFMQMMRLRVSGKYNFNSKHCFSFNFKFLGCEKGNSHFERKAEEDSSIFPTLFAEKLATLFCMIKMGRSFEMPERSSFLAQMILGGTLSS